MGNPKMRILVAYGGMFNRMHNVEPRVHIMHPTKEHFVWGKEYTLCGRVALHGEEKVLRTTKMGEVLLMKTTPTPIERMQSELFRRDLVTCKACRKAGTAMVREAARQRRVRSRGAL